MWAIHAARGVPRDAARVHQVPPAVKSDTPVMVFTKGDKGEKTKGVGKSDMKTFLVELRETRSCFW